jgi:RNA polymerase sigma-70 factor (ECF subfamily)
VQAALSALSFDHRAILMLREVEGLSGEEIAVTLGVPAGTVKSRLARAREALRRRVVAAGNGRCEGVRV